MLFAEINSVNVCIRLQHNLDVLYNGCNAYYLKLNVSKCNDISYIWKVKVNLRNYDYSIDGTVLKRLALVNDLGIYFICKLSFAPNI